MPEDLRGTLRDKLFLRDDFFQATSSVKTLMARNVALHFDEPVPLEIYLKSRSTDEEG
jgi:hypothetical protein